MYMSLQSSWTIYSAVKCELLYPSHVTCPLQLVERSFLTQHLSAQSSSLHVTYVRDCLFSSGLCSCPLNSFKTIYYIHCVLWLHASFIVCNKTWSTKLKIFRYIWWSNSIMVHILWSILTFPNCRSILMTNNSQFWSWKCSLIIYKLVFNGR